MRTRTHAHTSVAVKAPGDYATRTTWRPLHHFEDAVGVSRETSLLIVSGQVDGDRIMPRFFEEGHDPMPVPRNAPGTGNEHEVSHP
jgi:hypothetical protein